MSNRPPPETPKVMNRSSLLGMNRIEDSYAQRVPENTSSLSERNAVLSQIHSCFGWVPFELYHALSHICRGRIGIGGSLAAPPLPHHRTYGSRIRRFGRASQGGKCPLTGRSSRRALTPVSSLTLSGSGSRLTDALPGFFTARTFLSFHPLSGNRSGLRPALWQD